MKTTTNNGFKQLSGLGTINGRNRINVKTADLDEIGVEIETAGSKKETLLEIFVPAKRSSNGSRRVGRFVLNGKQARALFNTLKNHYEE